MEEYNDIDNLFRSAIEPYEMTPSDKVWSSLKTGLEGRQTTAGSGLLYISITSFIAACLAAYSVFTSSSYTATIIDKQQQEVKLQNTTGDLVASNDAGNAGRSMAANSVGSKYNSIDRTNNQRNRNADAISYIHTENAASSKHVNRQLNTSNDIEESWKAAGNEDPECDGKKYSDDVIANAASASLANEGKAVQEAQPEAVIAPDATASQSEEVTTDLATSVDVRATIQEVRRRFSLDVFYAPQIANHTDINGDEKNSPTTSSDKFGTSYNAGALFRFDLSDKWSLSLGCSYSTMNYSTSVTTSYVVPQGGSMDTLHPKDPNFSQHFNDHKYYDQYFKNQYNTPCGAINIAGDPTINLSSAKPGDIIYITNNTGMRLQFVNIPLMIGFKISHRRFDYYADAGMAMNLLVGKVATLSIADAYTETTHEIAGLRKTSYSYQVGLGARYHLYKGWSIFMEPAYRRAITPITISTTNDFYPYYLDINTGLNIRF